MSDAVSLDSAPISEKSPELDLSEQVKEFPGNPAYAPFTYRRQSLDGASDYLGELIERCDKSVFRGLIFPDGTFCWGKSNDHRSLGSAERRWDFVASVTIWPFAEMDSVNGPFINITTNDDKLARRFADYLKRSIKNKEDVTFERWTNQAELREQVSLDKV